MHQRHTNRQWGDTVVVMMAAWSVSDSGESVPIDEDDGEGGWDALDDAFQAFHAQAAHRIDALLQQTHSRMHRVYWGLASEQGAPSADTTEEEECFERWASTFSYLQLNGVRLDAGEGSEDASHETSVQHLPLARASDEFETLVFHCENLRAQDEEPLVLRGQRLDIPCVHVDDEILAQDGSMGEELRCHEAQVDDQQGAEDLQRDIKEQVLDELVLRCWRTIVSPKCDPFLRKLLAPYAPVAVNPPQELPTQIDDDDEAPQHPNHRVLGASNVPKRSSISTSKYVPVLAAKDAKYHVKGRAHGGVAEPSADNPYATKVAVRTSAAPSYTTAQPPSPSKEWITSTLAASPYAGPSP